MIRIACRFLLGPALLVAGACGAPPAESGAGDDAQAAAAHQEPPHTDGAAVMAHEGLPLRAIMQRLAGDMASFSYALWLEDYDGMTAHSAAMADHPHMAPGEIRRIEATLGQDMPAFEAADEAVHQASVWLHEAARARRIDEVLEHLGEVQRGCVSCHTRFRDRLRTDTADANGQ